MGPAKRIAHTYGWVGDHRTAPTMMPPGPMTSLKRKSSGNDSDVLEAKWSCTASLCLRKHLWNTMGPTTSPSSKTPAATPLSFEASGKWGCRVPSSSATATRSSRFSAAVTTGAHDICGVLCVRRDQNCPNFTPARLSLACLFARLFLAQTIPDRLLQPVWHNTTTPAPTTRHGKPVPEPRINPTGRTRPRRRPVGNGHPRGHPNRLRRDRKSNL